MIVGIQSIPIVLVAAGLIGVVTSQQGGYQMQGNLPLYVMGSVVVQSVVLEMGPVLTAIVMIGRVGARITAELGTMKVSEADRRPVFGGAVIRWRSSRLPGSWPS